MTCARCEDLQEEVAYLRSELGLQINAGEVAAVKAAFKITDHKARLLLVLYRAKGRVVPAAQLEDALPPRYGDTDRSSNFISATVAQLRKITGQASVETVYGSGYKLSDDMRSQMAAALERNRVAA